MVILSVINSIIAVVRLLRRDINGLVKIVREALSYRMRGTK